MFTQNPYLKVIASLFVVDRNINSQNDPQQATGAFKPENVTQNKRNKLFIHAMAWTNLQRMMLKKKSKGYILCTKLWK
jgi:hypothetical protein